MNDFAGRQMPGNAAIPALSQLNVYLAEGYSLACQGCWVAQQRLEIAAPSGDSSVHQPGTPSWLAMEIIFQAIREALPLGLSTVRLTGGGTLPGGGTVSEPLLYPAIDALLDQLENLELSVSIETSGAGLTAERAARLACLPQANVMIGLYGADAATQDQITRLSGSFQNAVHAARALAEAGLPPQFIFVINRSNSGQMAAAIHLAEELGASSVRFLPGLVRPCGFSSTGLTVPKRSTHPLNGHNGNGHKPESQPELLTVEELIALSRRMERELVHNTPVRLSFDLPPAFRGLNPTASIDGLGRCEVLNQLSLLPGGEYGLCGAVSSLTIGRVEQNQLGDLWCAHPTLQTLRASLPAKLDGVCERCIMKTACLGNCAVENYLRSGSFCKPHWFCQTADRVGLFPASRLIENRW